MANLAVITLLLFLCSLRVVSSYDFIKLVQQWPKSLCTAAGPKCKNPPPMPLTANFTIHGVWPSNNTGNQPNHCSGPQYNSQLIQVLNARLLASWPSFTLKPDDKFWEDEWEKHGTCSSNNFNQLAYFTLALDLKDQVDLLQELKTATITPGSFHPLKSFQVAIQKRTNKQPEIRCNQDKIKRGVQLHEIVLCLDDKATTYIDCPSSLAPPVMLCASSQIFFPN